MSRARAGLALAVLLAAGPLAGCDGEDERPVHWDKGVYEGPRGAALPADTLSALARRVERQRF